MTYNLGQPTTSSGPDPALAQRIYYATGRLVQSRANWFFWIAGLAILNSILDLAGSPIVSAVAPTLTSVLTYMWRDPNVTHKAPLIAIYCLFLAIFVIAGVFGRRGSKAAYLTGIVAFTLDGVLTVMLKDWISLAVHIYVIYKLFEGFMACSKFAAAGRMLQSTVSGRPPIAPA